MADAELYSLDDVVISRTIPFPTEEAAKFYKVPPIEYLPPPIVPLNRDIDETGSMSIPQMINYLANMSDYVDPDIWQYLWSRKVDVYGNTGRPNNRHWIDLTEGTLIQGELSGRFKNIYFRPHDVSGIESKGAAIAELLPHYEHITHFDKDPWVVFGLAKVFPTVQFRLVQDLFSGQLFTQEEMAKFLNVQRVAQLYHEEDFLIDA